LNGAYLDEPNRRRAGRGKRRTGLPPKSLIGIPWLVALALQEDGWTLRDAVIWHKPSPMPSSQRDRCTSAYEFVFQLTKGPKYFFDLEAIKCWDTGQRGTAANFGRESKEAEVPGQRHKSHRLDRAPTEASGLSAPRNVWRMASDGYKGEHYATFPVALPLRCIQASTSTRGCCPACGAPWVRIVDRQAVARERPNELTKRTGADGTGNHCANTVAGVESRTLGWEPMCMCARTDVEPCRVLDPFNGAGTTAIACRRLGVDYVGIDLDERAVEQTLARLRREANRGAKLARVKPAANQTELFA
jgi:hypothetical protein